MKRYALTVLGVLAVFAALFVALEAAGVPLLQDPDPWLQRGGWAAAAVGVGLLVVDVLVPVPSSFVMVAHGALFGVWVGALLSLAGATGAAAVAFWIGRRGGSLLARVVSPEERARANRWLAAWGPLAVLVTRPVPLVAETVAVLAGASPMGWAALLASAVVGNVPAAVVYALAGDLAADFASQLLVLAGVLVLAALSALVLRRQRTTS